MFTSPQPKAVVPGATLACALDENGQPNKFQVLFDKKGRPVWNMPHPKKYVLHYKTEGTRRAFLDLKDALLSEVSSGQMDRDEANEKIKKAFLDATHQVPVYEGHSASVWRDIQNQQRREKRKAAETSFFKKLMGGNTG